MGSACVSLSVPLRYLGLGPFWFCQLSVRSGDENSRDDLPWIACELGTPS